MSPITLGVGFLAGLITILLPCVLPVLPAVIAAGVTTGGRRRAFAIAIGLAAAFGFTTLLSIRVLSALHLPDGLRFDIAKVALFILAFAFIVPKIGEWVERPFARIGFNRSADPTKGGFVLGATLGLLYLPCGGPILSTIATVGSSGTISGSAVALTAAYSIGIALPIFGLVLGINRLSSLTTWLRENALLVRRIGGVLMLVSALAITFGAATALQKATPAFAAHLENHLTKNKTVAKDLTGITHPNETKSQQTLQSSTTHTVTPKPPRVNAPPADQVPVISTSSLHNYGPAPDFAEVTKWFNTPGNAPLSLSQLHGKVVLIDFWTYSCINCLRSLPHVEAWYSRYHSAGLEVIGVHTPEFDFERVPGNVQSAIGKFGVHYPVAMDNDYGTWNAWANNSWPAEYLIDASGNVRYGSIGESDYGLTEGAIRALLKSNGATLPPTTYVPNRTPTEASTPESYLGYERLARYDGTSIVKDKPATYAFASSLDQDHLTYSGQWTVESQDIAAGANASLRINVRAKNIYLVLSGNGTVTGTLNGKPVADQEVAGVPVLHTIVSGTSVQHGLLQLQVPAGVKAYAFTFG